jgi:hypothetical protein
MRYLITSKTDESPGSTYTIDRDTRYPTITHNHKQQQKEKRPPCESLHFGTHKEEEHRGQDSNLRPS